ncbi:DUF2252 domain-containing protein [Nocardioides sp. WL0053]|uniref:DUF2252 domain-containing protein n=1 Tax=Nocardioides jiangsuensis TaxID=2866161 RepID=A0ABS7REF9_9ACTN|nr:DUF2252 domain-containing protein [Nocardioides jiangsuensis]MBY9073411.1 DUF2252 domain-containing protein [Nocardioides jiangsuensis]
MMTEKVTHPSAAETRARLGAQMRTRVPAETHAELNTTGRPDPVQVLADETPSRLQELVPLRHSRMLTSPFAFFRGGAGVMAGDLARQPNTGLTAQLCGDAHLSNFGMFASPERHLLFDVNDFDETLPGPWEWDVKRLAASLAVAARQNGYADKQARKIVLAAVRRYQLAMHAFAELGNLAVWYARVDVDELQAELGADLSKTMSKRLDRTVKKARGRDHLRSLNKLTAVVDGRRRFVADPPLLVPLSQVVTDRSEEEAAAQVKGMVRQYSGTLPPGPRELVRSYDFVDMARKVVGVGSVGTRCWVILLIGRDENDPLFLQVKEAGASALAPFLPRANSGSQGVRVVTGQRIMQATSDIFLGSQTVVGIDGVSRDFYLRQLQDWKGSLPVEAMIPKGMRLYGELCAWTLARAHARSGDRIAIASYLGHDDAFAHAVEAFAQAYADLNEQDYARFAAVARRDLFLGRPHPDAPSDATPEPLTQS